MICYQGTFVIRCCFFGKHLGRLVSSVLTISARERRNNAASPNLLQLNSFCVGIFFWSAFVIRVAGTTQLFLANVSETTFLRGKIRASTNSLYYCECTFSIESTKARSSSLYTMFFSELDKQILQEWIDWEQSPTTMV